MPKRSTLKFRDAIAARAWITDPKGEPQDLRQKVTQVIVTYQSTRPVPGRRTHLQEGADRFLKAARLADQLLLVAEAKRQYGEGVSMEGALPRRLRRALQACTMWSTEQESLFWAYLSMHKVLEARGYSTEQELTRETLGLLEVGAGVPCPGWWFNDHDRMASAVINLRVMAFFFQREAYARRRQGGRPRDGNRFELIQESRKLGVTVRTVAQLLAGLMTDPPGMEDPRVAFNTPVPREWYEVREEAWFRGLNEALKQERDRRKKGGKPVGNI